MIKIKVKLNMQLHLLTVGIQRNKTITKQNKQHFINKNHF